MKIKWFEKKVDERQEMDLLRVEHIGFWCMFWMLLVLITVQGMILDRPDLAAGEWITFMAGCMVVLVGCIRKGVWGFQTRKAPGTKDCLKYSVIGTFLAGLPLGLIVGLKNCPGDTMKILWIVLLNMAVMFAAFFAAYMIAAALTRKRVKKLEEQVYEEEEGD